MVNDLRRLAKIREKIANLLLTKLVRDLASLSRFQLLPLGTVLKDTLVHPLDEDRVIRADRSTDSADRKLERSSDCLIQASDPSCPANSRERRTLDQAQAVRFCSVFQ